MWRIRRGRSSATLLWTAYYLFFPEHVIKGKTWALRLGATTPFVGVRTDGTVARRDDGDDSPFLAAPSPASSRRSFVAWTVATATTCRPLRARAEDVVVGDDDARRLQRRPFAPTEALLPATRLRVYVGRIHDESRILRRDDGNDEDRRDALVRLDRLLSDRPNFFSSSSSSTSSSRRGAASRTTQSLLGQFSTGVSPAARKRYREDGAMGGGGGGGGDPVSALLARADVERQWGMLRYQESERERADSARAALNHYTSRLVFADSYRLTASTEERKRLIREERLPTATAVVVSDLDLRDLIRNRFLTALDDAAAESSYRVRSGSDDVADVAALVDDAKTSLDEWFARIPPEDVRAASEAVLAEDR